MLSSGAGPDGQYDAWLMWNPTGRCNLNCRYCSNYRAAGNAAPPGPAIDVAALVGTMDRTGKIFRLQFTGGGEPFLVPNLVDVCAAITRRHYTAINTNLTSAQVGEFCERIDPRRVIVIRASLHFRELERLGLLERFIDNFHCCRERGFNISALEVGWPLLLPEVEIIRARLGERGIAVGYSHFIGTHAGKSYPAAYTDGELRIFGLTRARVNSGRQQGELCNAGYNTGMVDPDGTIYPCNGCRESIGNIFREIIFRKSMLRCPLPLCTCPLKEFDPQLFQKAAAENRESAGPPPKS